MKINFSLIRELIMENKDNQIAITIQAYYSQVPILHAFNCNSSFNFETTLIVKYSHYSQFTNDQTKTQSS